MYDAGDFSMTQLFLDYHMIFSPIINNTFIMTNFQWPSNINEEEYLINHSHYHSSHTTLDKSNTAIKPWCKSAFTNDTAFTICLLWSLLHSSESIVIPLALHHSCISVVPLISCCSTT